MLSLLPTLLLTALSAVTVHSIPTITTKGSKFFTSNGDQWFIKGVAYQLTPDDPLIDSKQCSLDAAMMAKLGANAIRVYHVGDGDHSACMTTFADAGIYLFVDLDTFTTDIDQTDPRWTQPQAQAFEAVMDEFQKYDNTAGFFIGNEVLTNSSFSEAAVFVKAATRDLKAYRDSKNYREIPIGYSHADISSLRPNLQNYLACGSDTSQSVDFFGLNAYEWCGESSYKQSGYDILTSQVMSYPVPIFLSETGCNTPEPRTFQDMTAIFGPQMAPYWSGAIVYEWIQEVNHFGLITYGGNANALESSSAPVIYSGTPTPVTPDFANLMGVWSTVSPVSTSMADYSPSLTPPPCPAYTSGVWEVAGDVALPTLGQTYDAAVQYSITKGQASGQTGAATSAPTASSTHNAASGGRELAGMSLGLGSVMLGFIYWL